MSTAYRFRIHDGTSDLDDFYDPSVATGNAVVVTSYVGGTNAYITTLPSGDGASFDPLTGVAVVGAYRLAFADEGQFFTAVTVDGNGRMALLGRAAVIETTADAGATFATLVPGFVTDMQKAVHEYTVTIGEARRRDARRALFREVTTRFNGGSNLIGTPVRGGFYTINDYGGWRFRVGAVQAGVYVRLDFKSGYVPGNDGGESLNFFIGEDSPRFHRVTGIPDDLRNGINEYARSFAVKGPPLITIGYHLAGTFPRLRATVANPSSGAEPAGGDFVPYVRDEYHTLSDIQIFRGLLNPSGQLYLQWTSGQPSVGTEYDVWLGPLDISPTNPLHYTGNPVDLLTDAYDETETLWDATEAALTRAAIGGDQTVAVLRFTRSYTLEELERLVGGVFGIGVRMGAGGRKVLFPSRARDTSAPVTTITLADLQADGAGLPLGVIFKANESSVRNRVRLNWQSFRAWRDADGPRPIDLIIPSDHSDYVDAPNPAGGYYTDTEDVREEVYTLPGNTGTPVNGYAGTQVFLGGVLAPSVFDVHATGADESEITVLSTITAPVGAEVALAVPHQNNGTTYGGTRYVRILHRTELATGAALAIRNAGLNAQPTLAPTFTLAADANDPRHVATVTVTNAAAMAAAGNTLNVGFATGPTMPTGDGLVYTPWLLDLSTTSTFDTPTADAGAKVWVRLRSLKAGQRPGSWTAWQSVTLTAIVAPSGLTATPAADGTQTVLAWTVGDTDVPAVVEYKLSAASTWTRADQLPPGSVQYTLTGLTPGAAYDARVSEREDPPYAGASSYATVSFTAGSTTPTLSPPTDPAAFAGSPDGSGVLTATGVYGLEVTAGAVPGFVDVEVAVETAVGSGVAGTYVAAGSVAAVSGGRTRWSGTAPNDGLLRFLRARSRRDPATPSAYTVAVSVDPWSVAEPIIRPAVSVTATPVATATPRIDVTVTSSRRGTIRLYRKAGGAASTSDTLVGTSTTNADTSLQHSSTGLSAGTVYYYLAVATDLATGVTSAINASARASATFPAAGSDPHIDSVTLGGDAFSAEPPQATATLTVGGTYGDAAGTDVMHILAGKSESEAVEVDSFTTSTGASVTFSPRSITMKADTLGTLVVVLELRTSGGTLRTSRTFTASDPSFYRVKP